jgi:choline dehydrogenase
MFSGSRAVGVTWLAGTRPAEATADRIVVSAGVYNTPAVLQRSGIGPADLLRTHAIPIVADLPVGRGLTDHPGAPFLFRAEGIAGTIGRFFAANWRGAAVGGEPWWQTHPFPVDEEEGICGLWTYLCRQHSSGTVEITGTDPRVSPLIDHDYLADPQDTARFADAWQANRALLATAPFRNHNARFLDPIDDLPTYLAANLGSAHHQSGSCRMGVDPTVSVVDPQLRVHGIDGLFVADSSVFPDTVMHNTNLMCYALGEVVGEAIARSQ